MDLADAFKIYSHKGCVYQCQRIASRAFNVLHGHLTAEERRRLMVGEAHASLNEGRGEFDQVCKDIGKRLGLLEEPA